MRSVVIDGNYDSWRAAARDLLARDVPPSEVEWSDRLAEQPVLLHGPHPAAPSRTDPHPSAPSDPRPSVPRAFVERSRLAACHRRPDRWAILYRALWRITHGERDLLTDPLDADARDVESMVAQVKRDEHKMHAFVRFREVRVAGDEAPRYIAWHRPDHFIVRLAAPLFVERFRTMRWSILTPDECAHWEGEELLFTPGVDASQTAAEDALEDLWRTYYAAVFNPARVNTRAMKRELPVRHWATLPEAQLIPSLVETAGARVGQMIATPSRATSARPFLPAESSIAALREAAATCQGCPLFAPATQTVFGAGAPAARLMLVGEQPGDEEDTRGVPFVGPAGKVLDQALVAAGVDRQELYVTNAVKHFTFRREGKRRIHQTPRATDVRACRPWLEAEIDALKPAVVVCMGSTAAQALLGPQVRIQRDRGRVVPSHWAPHVMVTYHPSAVLRADTPTHSQEVFDWLTADLRSAAALLSSAHDAPAS